MAIFISKGLPDKIEEFNLKQKNIDILELLVLTNFAPSRSEARRLVIQGGVTIDNKKITDPKFVVDINNGDILKVGKRNFVKLMLI